MPAYYFLLAFILRFILGVYYDFYNKPFIGDEIVYVKAGEAYINHFLEGHKGLDQCLQYNLEHPMFAKMMYGLSIFYWDQF